MSNECAVEPFKVFIRIRPLNDKEVHATEKYPNLLAKKNINEKEKIKSIFLVEDNLLFVLDPSTYDLTRHKEKSYAFDNIFTEEIRNELIFQRAIAQMIDNVLNGYNSTALAYGVTGTGKTHTMFGDMESFSTGEISKDTELGVCLYAVDYLFDKISMAEEKIFSVKISYLEIYNEQVMDLLVPKSPSLMIVEDSVKGVVVPELSEISVTNSKDLIKVIMQGNSRRTMAPTNQNQFSSRSHAILQVLVEQRNKIRDTKEEVLISKFLVVDLAGSERGGLEKGLRREEGSSINKSLLSLGNCINLLSDKTKKGAFIPYRDSKLTRLLKDSLGGNILTVMIACVSPTPLTYDESINTLNYASRARTIQKKITKNVKEVNVHIAQYKEIIDSLKSEIEHLKDVVRNQQIMLEEKEPQMPTEESEKEKEKEKGANQKVKDEEMKESFMSRNNEVMHKSAFLNPMGNYSVIYRKKVYKDNKTQVNANATMRTAHNINLDIYKLYLENDENNNLEDLEQYVENLQNDKNILEEFLEKSKILDKSVNEKYKELKNYYEKYLELINDKLVENIEQNMILKFNMKELFDLNHTNNSHLGILFSQISNLENIKQDRLTNGLEEEVFHVDEDINKMKEEIENIQMAIVENEKIKEKIAESLTRNLKLKKMLKKILISLISNSKSAVSTSLKESLINEKAYQKVLKEKEELECTNAKFQNILKSILRDKEQKNTKINDVLRELEFLKRQLIEKDNKIKEFESKKAFIPNEIEVNLFDDKQSSCQMISEIGIHDEYSSNTKKMINDIEAGSNGIISNEREDSNNRAYIDNDTKANIQNIKYIINQTNNIVNNNINKVLNKERNQKSSANIRSNLSIDKKSQESKEITYTQPSEKIVKKNHLPKNQADKTIESQLNEVYRKKAQKIGEKVKKSRLVVPISKKDHKQVVEQCYYLTETNRDNEQRPVAPMDLRHQVHPKSTVPVLNHSLSISQVSYTNEVGFNSELDIVANIPSTGNKRTCLTTLKKEVANDLSPSLLTEENQIVQATPKESKHREFFANNANLQKFVNACSSDRNNSNDKSLRDKPLTQPPHCNSLLQARLEKKQLKSLSAKEGEENGNTNTSPLVINQNILFGKVFDSSNSTSNINPRQNIEASPIVKDILFKKSEIFLNNYSKAKKNSAIDMDRPDEISERKTINNENSTCNRIELPKNILAEAALNSLVNIKTSEINTTEAVMVEEKEIQETSTEEMFKCIGVSLKTPKLAKFLDCK